MGNNVQPQSKRYRRRRIWIVVGAILLLLLIFHRPILLGTIHWYAVRFAAKQNLKLQFRAEGNVFTALTIRNLHITPSGPAAIEVADADYFRAEYNLFALLRGRKDFLDAVEARNARVIIDPGKVRVKVQPRPREKVTLPAVFPERALLQNVSVIVRDPAHDLIAENVSVELNPRVEALLSADLLQLPSGEAWSHVTGRTSYQNRNLVLRDVVLNEGTRFSLINVDASQINQHTLMLKLDGTLDTSPINLHATLKEQANSVLVSSHLAAKNLSLASARKLGIFSGEEINGDVENFAVDFAGLLSSPRTWNATATGSIRDLAAGGLTFDRTTLQINARDGSGTIQPIELTRSGASVQIHGSIQLPERADDLVRSPARLEINSSQLDLASLTSSLPKPLSGHIQINGSAEVKNEALQSLLQISSDAINNADFSLEKMSASILVREDLHSKEASWFEEMHANINVAASAIRARDLVADGITAEVEQIGSRVTLTSATIHRANNEIVAKGAAILNSARKSAADTTAAAALMPAQFEISVNAPQLGDFCRVPNRVSGPLFASANVHWDGEKANGWFSAFGSNLQAFNLPIPWLDAAGSIYENKIFLNDFTAKLNQRDFVNASGALQVDRRQEFAGKIVVDIANLNTLQPILAGNGNKTELGGSFVMNWEGRGSIKKLTENGLLKLAWKNGRLGNMRALQANVDATYSAEALDIPTIFIGSDRMDFQAIVSARGDRLEISKIQLDQGQAKYASGFVSIPFVWKNVGTGEPVFPRSGKVEATFQSENLDLKKMFDDFGLPATASGFVNLKIDAGGTLEDLRAHAEVDARDLRNPQLPKLDPATLRITADAAQNKINVIGQLKQPKIQPVDISATMPFDAGEVLSKGSLNENSPIQANVRLPRSPVNFLRQFIPFVEQLDGDAALDVAISGTIARPILSGSGDITINAARPADPTLPTLRGFQSRLTFRENTLVLERFRGDLAGGPFTISGRVIFPKLTQPNLDIDIRADSVLVARNDSLTARADANLKISGPIANALVKGNIALTNSHFLKDIDLIPIGLPGRPAPPPIEDRPDYSIKDPPLRDWKFDVAVKTKDPFSIRGNLANGGAVADIHLGGTGGRPALSGTVRLEGVEATLPFSRLEVTNGFLYFDPNDSFNPRIELQGNSVIRDYTIRVYVYGSSLAPQAVFTSEPPLPQEEIISLLATGTTRQELTGNNQVLVGRAAMLVVQQLYRKIFKKGEPTQSNSVFDRLQVDLGTVDPRTGREQATARFKVNDNWVLVGDIGVGGEFRGLVKYLIRFH